MDYVENTEIDQKRIGFIKWLIDKGILTESYDSQSYFTDAMYTEIIERYRKEHQTYTEYEGHITPGL